jgi:CO/xanthine dehydrogenase Mo-binding subunit
MPLIDIELITEDTGGGPFGAKSIGELSNSVVAPAIANAVHDAVGVRAMSLPITAEKVYRAMRSPDAPEHT